MHTLYYWFLLKKETKCRLYFSKHSYVHTYVFSLMRKNSWEILRRRSSSSKGQKATSRSPILYQHFPPRASNWFSLAARNSAEGWNALACENPCVAPWKIHRSWESKRRIMRKRDGRPAHCRGSFSGATPEAQDSFIDSAVRVREFDLTLIARRPRAKCTAVHPDKERDCGRWA